VSPIRVAFLSSYTGLGGGETSLLALLAAIDHARIDPVLVCPRDGKLPEAARHLGIAVHLAPFRPASVWFVPSLAARSRGAGMLQRALRAINPQAIYSGFHTLPLVAGAGSELRCPILFACYGWWFHPRPWQRAFHRRVPARVVAISEAVRRGFLGEPPFMSPERVEVVPLGVDTTAFAPRPEANPAIRRSFGLPADGAVVSLVARFQRVKGHDVFLESARRVLDALPHATFAIAGENVFDVAADERFKRRVLREVRGDPRLRERVRLLGWVERSELLLAASDVVVVSSRFESFGMVGVEAMACGVPVVSVDRGGPAETIVDGETGYLVPPERPGAIAARVIELLRDGELRRHMGEAGRARVQERFTVQRYAERVTAVIETVAGR